MMASTHSELVTERLAAAKAAGVRLGWPVRQSDSAREMIATLRGQGLTMQQTAQELTEQGYTTARGGQWWPSSIRSVEQAEKNDLKARRGRLRRRCFLLEDDIMFAAHPKPVLVGAINPDLRLSPWVYRTTMRSSAGEVMGFSEPEVVVPAATQPDDVLKWIDIQREDELKQVEARLEAIG